MLAAALTWDGARFPVRSLPTKARAFLRGAEQISAKQMAELFAVEPVAEVRICWVPQLAGGDEVLCDPFDAPSGKRVSYRCIKTHRFGDVLGVVYRAA